MIKIKFIVFIVLLFSYNSITSQGKNHKVEQKLYTKLDGLPSKEITCGLQDKFGFLWFGTKNGLCRFDGKKFELFNKNTGLRGKQIINLIYDDSLGIVIFYSKSNSDIVMETYKDVMNVKTLKISSFENYYKNTSVREADMVHISPLINSYKFFIELNVHRYKYPFQNIGKPCCYLEKGKVVTSIFNLDYYIYTNKQGNYAKSSKLTTDTSDFNLLFLKNGAVYMNLSKKLNCARINDSSILCSEKKAFWIYNNQLKDVNSSQTIQKMQGLMDTSALHNYTSNSFLCDTKAGKLLLVKNSTEFIDITLSNLYLNLATVNSTFFDKQNNYWLCTDYGIVKTTITENYFKTVLPNVFSIDKLNSIREMHISPTQTVVCGAYKLYVQNLNTSFTILTGSNYAICKTDSQIWIGNYSLNTINLKTKKLQQKAIIGNEIWCIHPQTKTQLLIGSSFWAHNYNITNNTLTKINPHQFPEPYLVYNYFKNSLNEWCMVADNGFYILNDKATDVINYYGALSLVKPKQFPFEGITAIQESTNNVYWITTANDGLYLWDRNKNTFKQFGYEAGFLTLTCYALQKDNEDNLWISTDLGLAHFNTKTLHATFYAKQNGIQEEEFNRISSFKDGNGNFYFGGLNGITTFNPKEISSQKNKNIQPLLLKKISVFNADKSIEEDLSNSFDSIKDISIHEYQKKLTIDFIYIDYSTTNYKATNYAYKLQGFDDNWQYTTNTSITYNSLPYGEYKLIVKAQTNDGSWNTQTITIPILVLKPFYKQIWFFIVVGLGILLLFTLWFWYRIQKAKKENLRLELLVDNRTHDLQLSLKEQTALMQELHHRVKNNLQFITAMLKLQIKTSQTNENKEVLNNTSRRIDAISLIHDMLYNKDKIERISLKNYVTELINKLHDFSINDKQPVDIKLQVDDVYFNINSSVAIGMIISELISNALKYAFTNTAVPQINITVKLMNDDLLELSVTDNGVGIDANTKSKGLGMRLIDIFCKQLQGKYSITNNQGTLFKCIIPYKKL